MDPASQPTPSFEMQRSATQAEVPGRAAEQAAVPEMSPMPQLAPPPLSVPLPVIDATMFAASPMPAAPAQQPIAAPAIADDIDLIEKEWVDKAKAIVTQTRNDPHTQNKEMNRFKADYMKKRYNKDIKLPESS